MTDNYTESAVFHKDAPILPPEKPILFSGPMVRAILDGRKTQTRRILKPQPTDAALGSPPQPGMWDVPCGVPRIMRRILERDLRAGVNIGRVNVGTRLWVRESWRAEARNNVVKPALIKPGSLISYDADYDREPNDGCRGKSRPSIHMPRWASRLLLEVTAVKVERLQDISEEDAKAEGAIWHDGGRIHHSGWRHNPDDGYVWRSPILSYARIWELINGKGTWDANPWVCAISFKRIEAAS